MDLSKGPTPGIRRSYVCTHVRVSSKGFHLPDLSSRVGSSEMDGELCLKDSENLATSSFLKSTQSSACGRSPTVCLELWLHTHRLSIKTVEFVDGVCAGNKSSSSFLSPLNHIRVSSLFDNHHDCVKTTEVEKEKEEMHWKRINNFKYQTSQEKPLHKHKIPKSPRFQT
ncbi:hypothetical protein LAZ67_12001030 [Cordylochernes scorpioides]|uniref:Uncharacterized protein n=1 Tax=Cordylochernes scorpioides TaxID=51811 RepID=A0ABY6L0Y8_9ARAC|nr:hypothetical protein LAZ67_12001030 [Cordylochernes scorpioides]